jgi:hypothetical protein
MKYYVRDTYGFVEYLRYDPEWEILLRVIYCQGPGRTADIGVTRYADRGEPTEDVKAISEDEFDVAYDAVMIRLKGWRRKRGWLSPLFKRILSRF